MRRTSINEAARWAGETSRTTYRFDVRTPEEYESAHAPGFQGAPGGQLVQETEMFVPVRGARVVLFDDDGVRANMTASWLAQMNIDTYVVDGAHRGDLTEAGAYRPERPHPAPSPKKLAAGTGRAARRYIGRHRAARCRAERELGQVAHPRRALDSALASRIRLR